MEVEQRVEICRLSRKQCDEIAKRLFERKEERYFHDQLSKDPYPETYVMSDEYPFFAELAHYINENKMCDVEIEPTDIMYERDIMTDEVIVSIPYSKTVRSTAISDERMVNCDV